MVLRRVRAALHELHAVVFDRLDREDTDALVDFFRSRSRRAAPRERPIAPASQEIFPSRAPCPSGSSVKAAVSRLSQTLQCRAEALPLKLHIRCAYDVLSGNPFRRYSEYDFSFFSLDIQFEKVNADCWPTDFNEFDSVRARRNSALTSSASIRTGT